MIVCSRAGVVFPPAGVMKRFLLQPRGGSDLSWQQLMGGVCDDIQPVKHVQQTLQPSQPSLRAAAGSQPAAFLQLLLVFTSAATRCCTTDRQKDRQKNRQAGGEPGEFGGDGCCWEPAGEEQPHGVHRQKHAVCVGRLPGEQLTTYLCR